VPWSPLRLMPRTHARAPEVAKSQCLPVVSGRYGPRFSSPTSNNCTPRRPRDSGASPYRRNGATLSLSLSRRDAVIECRPRLLASLEITAIRAKSRALPPPESRLTLFKIQR